MTHIILNLLDEVVVSHGVSVGIFSVWRYTTWFIISKNSRIAVHGMKNHHRSIENPDSKQLTDSCETNLQSKPTKLTQRLI